VSLTGERTTDRGEQRPSAFGRTPEGSAVELHTLTNAGGIELRVITYGGIIVSLRIPDRDGRLDDVVLGHDDLAGYLESDAYFGAIIGRYGNRIACGRFTVDGVTHQLVQNNGRNHLHGGARGFDKVVWNAEPFVDESSRGVALRYESVDGEQGYPGSLSARVTYTLGDHNELIIDYEATASRVTPVNLTQHTYWNLGGQAADDVLDHELMIDAETFTPVDDELIPTGALASVAGTPFDFREPRRVGARVDGDDEQLRHAGGYDHNFVLRRSGAGLSHAARLVEPVTGRVVDVHTTEPGLQFYSGNFLDGSIRGKSGRVYGHRGGLCLETQHFPDSPNQPHFPPTILRPGDTYRSKTVYAFGVAPDREGASRRPPAAGRQRNR
jgi:aldose 1-epimerase